MVLAVGAFVPGIVADEKPRAHGPAQIRLIPHGLDSSGKIFKQVKLISLIQSQSRPGRPNADHIVSSVEFFAPLEEILQGVFTLFDVIVKLVPSIHQVHDVGVTDPLQILPLKQGIVKRLDIKQHFLLKNPLQTSLPISGIAQRIKVIINTASRKKHRFKASSCAVLDAFPIPTGECGDFCLWRKRKRSITQFPGIVRDDHIDRSSIGKKKMGAGKGMGAFSGDQGFSSFGGKRMHIVQLNRVLGGIGKGDNPFQFSVGSGEFLERQVYSRGWIGIRKMLLPDLE